MRFSANWLTEWIDHGLTDQELADRLTMAGLEVDAIEAAAPEFSGVVVGEVLAVEPHPDADKLSVCRVSDGEGEHDVVCGADNVHVGMRAPYAQVGAELPDGTRIRKAKLRGVASSGMLCSPRELRLSEEGAGLMALPQSLHAGTDLRTALALDDRVIELDLTPNRGDCLGMIGIAREVGALTGKPVCRPPVEEVGTESERKVGVSVEDAGDCPAYAGRVIEGIDTRAESPVWLQERLRRAGLRPISPVVDVTNYVMLELGQPMHGFRLEALQGDISVRRARKGERLILLDDRELELDPELLVIADESGPVALAGIMGGRETGVDARTADVFLESACFAPTTIAGKARSLGMQTDSSHRFERGVDPEIQERALDRATNLIQQIAGGRAGERTLVRGSPVARPEIRLRRDRLRAVLGFELPDDRVSEILKSLWLEVILDDAGWKVTPPSFRHDLGIEEDLIEEVARIHGYDQVPVESLPAHVRPGPVPEAEIPLSRLRQCLVERGYQEAITYSFVDETADQLLSEQTEPAIPLENPISSDLAVLRTSLWPGLLAALAHNVRRQQGRVRLFESGLKFIPQDDDIKQEKWVAGVAWGASEPEQWDGRDRPVDFYDIKADVEALIALGDGPAGDYTADRHPALHPGQTARISVAGQEAGWVGRLNPETAGRLDLPEDVYVFELPLAVVASGRIPSYTQVSRYPAVRRDLAFVVDESVPAGDLVAVAREAAGELATDVRVFDVYRGKGVDSGRKSIALGLILQDSSRTLTDEDADKAVAAVCRQLEGRFSATVRD